MDYSVLVNYLEESGFTSSLEGWQKSKDIAIGSDIVRVTFAVIDVGNKYSFKVDLSSVVFSILSEYTCSNITPQSINEIFRRLITSSFKQYSKDIISKVLPIEERFGN